jgi:hypothetical protein
LGGFIVRKKLKSSRLKALVEGFTAAAGRICHHPVKEIEKYGANIVAGFAEAAREIYHHPRKGMEKYGAYIAGWIWSGGNVGQLIWGGMIFSKRIITASVMNLTSSTNVGVFGGKNWAISAMSSSAITGTGLTIYPALADMEPAAWAGYLAFLGVQAIYSFSPLLTERFTKAKNVIYRNTLGRPRLFGAGLCIVCCRAPIIWEAAIHKRKDIMALFLVYTLGDGAFGLSKPKPSKPRQLSGTPKLHELHS